MIARSGWAQNVSFQTTEGRFFSAEQGSAAPPPGTYKPKTALADTIPKQNPRSGPFGSSLKVKPPPLCSLVRDGLTISLLFPSFRDFSILRRNALAGHPVLMPTRPSLHTKALTAGRVVRGNRTTSPSSVELFPAELSLATRNGLRNRRTGRLPTRDVISYVYGCSSYFSPQ